MQRRNKVSFSKALVQGATFIVALVEALPLQARPVSVDGLRLNTRNTPETAGDAYQTARSLLAIGDVPGALAAFRAAVLESPRSIDAINGLAVCYDRLGNYDVSRNYYDAALAIDPDAPLVLNNLGYSLYLQGKLQAAIPVLQRARLSADPAIGATSQRVLNLIAAKLRDDSARTSHAIALAEVSSPRARVELSASGEQRLVFGAPKLDRVLVASLGEEAALLTVAAPVVPRATPLRNPRSQGRDQTIAVISFGAGTAPVVTPPNSIAAMPARTAAAPATAAASVAPGVELATADTQPVPKVIYFQPVDAPDAAEPVATAAVTPPVAPAAVVVAAIAVPRPASSVRVARSQYADAVTPAYIAAKPARGRKGAPVQAVRVTLAANDIQPVRAKGADDADAPAWLLASRRVDKGSLGGIAIARGPQQTGALAGFDSDDPVLNAFAARMRGDIPLAANDVSFADVVLDRAAVIARLEALLARVRPA